MLLRLAAAFLLALAFAAPAQGAVRPAGGHAPGGLKGFLLRADEPTRSVFSRTPSFAWNPVPGAVRYEFQLSTSSVFRENAIVYSDSKLTTTAASLPLTLPWITGSPYSLYARVRAVLPKTITPWSDAFGFNMRWSSVAQPLPSYPGLLRWTPVEGADAYQVWFVDIGKVVPVFTNVVDEREFYTFHQGTQWVGTVRWRIRALRADNNGKLRVNGLPAVSYGPWSPIYSSVNPPFAVGNLGPVATVSDVVARGRSGDPAHRLMPAFVFTGNQGLAAIGTELYRVYVFTDSDCVNVVYKSAIVGSPAYAPRPYGPLSLPRTSAALAAARAGYLPDGDEGSSSMYDNAPVRTTESEPAAKPTTAVKTESAEGGTTGTSGSGSGSSGSSGSTGSTGSTGQPTPTAPAGQAPPQIEVEKPEELGAPVDLWDTDWPRGGYYWTVVPVQASSPASLTTSVVGVAMSGATTLPVAGAVGFSVGDVIEIGAPPSNETATVVAISGSTFTLSQSLKSSHGAGEPVVRTTGSLDYRDLELAQETCASGRVMRFGKTSEPVLTSSSAPFVSGLSPAGRLMAASTSTPRVYGTPHIAWAPALGAAVYEVQWSKTRYPFRAEADPRTQSAGFLTLGTSAILPLKPGSWWYRVRGINWSLRTGAQQMSWSEPAQVVVTRPQFRVERGR